MEQSLQRKDIQILKVIIRLIFLDSFILKELKVLSLLQKAPNHNEELKKFNGLLQINNSMIKSSKNLNVLHSEKNIFDFNDSKNTKSKNNTSLQALQRKTQTLNQRNAIKNKMLTNLSNLIYSNNIDDSDEDMTIPSEDVKISNVVLTSYNSNQSCKTLSLNSSVKSIPITTPRNNSNYSNSSKSILSDTQKVPVILSLQNKQEVISQHGKQHEQLNIANQDGKANEVKSTLKCKFNPNNIKNLKNYKK